MPSESRSPVIVVAPDSFKGSLSAQEAADAVVKGILLALPSCTVHSFPMGDGGEGTMAALLSRGGSRITVPARDAAGNMGSATVGLLADGSAIVEVAEIVGITDASCMAIPVEQRTSLGVGDALKTLLDKGVKKICVALGGSSTNDGGAGLLVALGIELFDAAGKALSPTPAALANVARVDLSKLDRRLAEVELIVMSDVDNPLTGAQGATATFGPQKGVTPALIDKLDANLAHYADHLEPAFKRSVRNYPGSGAAGGLGFALKILGAEIRSGAEVVADTLGVNEAIAKADWVITGEGRSDEQTLHGKAPFVICRRARAYGVSTTLLSGAVDAKSLPLLNRHFAGCFSVAPGPIDVETSMRQAGELLSQRAEQLARVWMAAWPGANPNRSGEQANPVAATL